MEAPLIDPSQLPEDFNDHPAPWTLERAGKDAFHVIDAEGATFAVVEPPNSTALRILEGKMALSQGKIDRLCPRACRTRPCNTVEDFITVYPICQCKLSCLPEMGGKVVAHLAGNVPHEEPAILAYIDQQHLLNLRSFPTGVLAQELARRLA